MSELATGGDVWVAPPPLLPVLGADDQMDAAYERMVQPIAERAYAGDRAARDVLYRAFEPKIRRFVRALRGATWDADDVAQEAYLVFLGVVERWNPAIPFGRYFLAHFRWRLRDAVYRGIGRRGVPPRFVAVTFDGPGWQDTVADVSTPEAEARVLIGALADSFEAPFDDILRFHILDGLTLTEIASQLGISRRTANRRWRVIRMRLAA